MIEASSKIEDELKRWIISKCPHDFYSLENKDYISRVFHRSLSSFTIKIWSKKSKIEEHDPTMNKILLKCSLWLQCHKILSNLVVLMLLFFFSNFVGVKLWFITMFYAGFIPWKKCCNCINLFLCILWDFVVLDLVLSWWRIKHEMKISKILRLARKKFVSKGSCKKAMWEAYAGSWRVKCQTTFREYFVRQAISWGTRETLYMEDFKCDFLSILSYYIYPHYPEK